mmetsp:Transcript_357/g.616  ORF Transcript_357/g.616 Transcript_357/m.616 type:complete len:853 (+) Transcript_357:60-2618(+)
MLSFIHGFCLVTLSSFLLLTTISAQKQVSKSTGPPAFFLQDPTDGQCLAGSKYKRCGIDTLWYVTGKPGSYQIHHRLVDENDDESCLDRAQCHLEESDVKLANCNHCGAKKWNILGDAQTGYVLTEDGNKNCLKRKGTEATMVRCDQGYSGLTLQFANKDDITAMGSDGARLISAASDGDLNTVKQFLKNKVDVNSQDWDNLTAVIAASGKGHLSTVKHLISNKADVNLRDKDNITALMEASMAGHQSVVEFLVKSGAMVEAQAVSGITSLWLAAGEGHFNAVKFLLSKKADPNNARSDGITCLMAACAGGHETIVKALLGAKADVQAKDKEGLTALISAAENGSVPIVKALLDNKAEVNVMSDTGFSPLIIASAHGHLEVVKMLLNAGAEMEMEHPESVTPLMYAAAGGFPDVVKLLIEKKADVNLKHKQGGSALMEAATAGNVTVIEVLLAAGADAFIVDDDGVTALMSAASQGHTEICRILVEKGLDVNQVAQSGGTAIMFAAGGGHNETTAYLLEKKADVNVIVKATPEYIDRIAKAIAEGKEEVEPHTDGVTALVVAAQGGHLAAAKMLVEAGAVVNIADDEGNTPLLNAVKGKYSGLATYLLEHGANANDVYVDDKSKSHNLLMDAVANSNLNFSLLLIEKGADVEFADEDGVTIVTQAAYQGLDSIVKALLEKGADPAKANNEGINALIAAASEGHSAIVDMLLKTKKCDVDSKDKDGTNALMAAAVRGHKDVISMLVSSGANVNAKNVDGHTALMFAYNGKNQVETLLDKYGEYMKDGNDNSTRVIKDALQTHVDVISMLVMNGADKTIQDNEGHTAADFDYKPPEIEPVEGSITPPPKGREEL